MRMELDGGRVRVAGESRNPIRPLPSKFQTMSSSPVSLARHLSAQLEKDQTRQTRLRAAPAHLLAAPVAALSRSCGWRAKSRAPDFFASRDRRAALAAGRRRETVREAWAWAGERSFGSQLTQTTRRIFVKRSRSSIFWSTLRTLTSRHRQ